MTKISSGRLHLNPASKGSSSSETGWNGPLISRRDQTMEILIPITLFIMIGAIVLTLRHRPDVKRQDVSEQNARTREQAVEIVKVPSRTGV